MSDSTHTDDLATYVATSKQEAYEIQRALRWHAMAQSKPQSKPPWYARYANQIFWVMYWGTLIIILTHNMRC